MVTKIPVRERLLDAATRLMFVDGSVSTPVDVLLKEAGASAASLYAHFGNKDGLLAAALDRRLQVWTTVWDEHWEAASTPSERLLSVFAAMTDYHENRLEERWCSFHATASAQPSPVPEVARVLAADREQLRRRLGLAAAEACPRDPERAQRLADQVEVAYEGMLALMLRGPSSEAIAIARSTAEELIAGACRVD
ncbi:TetR/AcrR family transcriptional regulator [Kytococcus sedentarius]|uniref:TetR/AcrR family transcriptional regulator n=1 Tax=Kytococcus sedentarius TaxID=1276 RepID=UPI0035BC6AFF